MFQKPAFGANTSGFGMQSTFGAGASGANSSFGGFKPASSTSAFGAPPAFGANTSAQTNTGGGLFGSTNTTGGLFGAPTAAAPTPAFGASGGFGFGASPAASTGGLFANNASTGLFGNSAQGNAFGAKPAGFGFGSTATSANQSTGLFGNTSTAGTGLFGGQTNTLAQGGLFNNTAGGFGASQAPTGTAHVKYNPLVGTDVVVKSGTSQNVNIKHHCITCMKEYESKSLEELRLEDYTAGRKGNRGGMFPFQQTQTENKPLFGATPAFGQPATTSAPSVFGGGGLSAGSTFGQPNSFSFGNNTTNTNTSGLFGANKPAFGATTGTGGGLFGAAASTAAPAFGTNTNTFGFGSALQNQTTGGGIFGAKPATSVFGSQPASTGFGGFGTGGGLFGAKPLQTQAPTFGAPQPGIGTQALGFGTSTSTSGGLFGANAFGKPAASQPSFGFGNTQPSLGVGLGSSFQNKSTAPAFGQLGASNMFQTTNANNSFRTGLEGGLGGGMFGNNSAMGGSALGFGMNANNASIANLSGVSAGNIHEQILTLAARPYGDSSLYKDLLPDSSLTAEDVLKPTNPSAMQAVLERSVTSYRVSSPTASRQQLLPNTAAHHDKKSLFDGLEEADASLEDKLSLKPSRKRLVLRRKQTNADTDVSNDSLAPMPVYRSQEEPQSRELNGSAPTGKENSLQQDETDRAKRNVSFGDSNNVEANGERQDSWLISAKSWNQKEKPMDNDPTPRLYPSLDTELPSEASERRASWLTTKPFRKPALSTESAENSVRDLGLRPALSASASPPALTEHGNEQPGVPRVRFCRHGGGVDSVCSHCVKITHQISGQYVSEEVLPTPVEVPPHPTGVKLTRMGYYTIPTLDELIPFVESDGTCVAPHLTIGRKNYGNVYYDSEVHIGGLDLDDLVHFHNKEIIVYPDETNKPPVGRGLNKRAIVTLDRVWPRDKTEDRPITDPDRLWAFEEKLRRVCAKHDTHFLEYRPQTGSWVFRVEHFSKYGWTESDDEEDLTPEVLKRQLANQALQKSQAPHPGGPKPPQQIPGPGLGGAGYDTTGDSIFAMQQASLNLLNGASRAFEMDTTEDNAESQSLYQDHSRGFGVKSPTTELARLENRQSHHVQLMKASLYADTEMEDDVSISTGDQLVPMAAPLLSIPDTGTTVSRHERRTRDTAADTAADECSMRPLIVRPHTIVLQYHRKVPPFKQTIAGRLGASPLAEMSVCRARHSRVGFGAGGAMAFATTYNALADLPKEAALSDISKYTRGREDNDWSEPIVARMTLQNADKAYNVQEVLSRQLDILFKFSTSVTAARSEHCPRLALGVEAGVRAAALRALTDDASGTASDTPRFGVSGAYCYEVWQLCDALWGADLDNGGVAGTDVQSLVNRHKKFLEWLKLSVADITDRELSKPTHAENEDESDGHSAGVWTLLLGGRVTEACKLAKDNGDLNLAILISQAAGNPAFRSLIQRQLTQWRECGADTLVSVHKRAILQLVSGSAPRELLALADWKQALHATARYVCPQVPTLERIIRTYESLFAACPDDTPDLHTLDDDAMGMQLPLPPYADQCEMVINEGNRQRRVLDLRYSLIVSRALNCCPLLSHAAYTLDPLDYSLCFVLGLWLGKPTAGQVVGAASQLEAGGAWHRAVHALCYHPDDATRSHLIREVLSRHAPARVDTPELKSRLDLMKKLNIPEKWVLLAQAHRAKYEHLPTLEVEYLVGAEQWNAAHKVLLEHLLPEAVLSDNLQSIAPILEKMNEAARRDELSGWASGGQALYHYLHVRDEIRGLVNTAETEMDRSSVSARLEALRPAVCAACRALHPLTAESPRHRAARAEMGARLVQLAVAGGEPPHHLAALLKALTLPPDYTANAQQKITTDLADQAAEMCIESATSSPMSSHHRATAAS